jgi:molecular chaperone HscB
VADLVPPDPRATPFDVLGVPMQFALDAKEIDRAWLTKSRAFHPDRFVGKPDRERRLAAEHTVALNDAKRAIEDPFDRAVWLVRHAGVAEAKLEQQLLVSLMEARERADEGEKDAVIAESVARFRELAAQLATLLANLDDKPALAKASRALAEMKTLARLVADLGGPKLIATLDSR